MAPPPPPPKSKQTTTTTTAAVPPSRFSPRFVRLSFNQTAQAVFGGAPGASPAAVALADDLARTANVVISASWLVFLFFVPALLEWARGARNAFAAMMFAWTGVS